MSDRVKEITEKLKTFREMQLLPMPKDLDFENWLENFQNPDEKGIAAHILKHFIYFSDDLIDQMLCTVIGRCGYYFTQNVPGWDHNNFKNNCWYSFVQGENIDDATDSGYIFTRKLREVLNIPDERIIKFEALFKKLENYTSTPQNVILVDDFVGSGAQTDEAWNRHKLGAWKMTLNEHQSRFNHRIIYAPLVVNDMGLLRIKRNCSNLHLEYIYHLGPEYNLFNVDGLCWVGDRDLYDRFLTMLNRIAEEQEIPIKGGNHVNDVRGFGEQGLALAFHHGIPDACPAFFYWKTDTWKPLKKRPYHR
ncbi:MAG: hypothetical protein J1F42_12455 [Lachnospiraceae bacterium]|nr:hypothetical protein [Lachnospiraceae bacterium]